MKPKSVKITYWILLVILCLFMAFDGFGGVTKQAEGVTVLNHLGFPIYVMPLLGVLKFLGVIALLQNLYQGVKEWVYAGTAFIFIGASVAHFCSHDTMGETIAPLIFLAFLFVVRYFWIRYEQVKNIAA